MTGSDGLREARVDACVDSLLVPRSRMSLQRTLATTVSLLTLLTFVLGGLALADPRHDPGEIADTAYTPVPSPTGAKELGWRQVGGAIFDSDQAQAQARAMDYEDTGKIPHTVDFFSVSFFNSERGLAAGAACKTPVAKPEDIPSCPRVPVIYQYESTDNQPPRWTEVYRGSDSTKDGKGYVGAIAWIDHDTALAVGGSGCYPRHEVAARPDGQPADAAGCVDEETAGDGREPRRKEPIAGDGRAWLFKSGTWRSLADDLPTAMTGLTAVAFSSRPSDCQAPGAQLPAECGLAGAYGQIWTWIDGAFRGVADMNTNSAYLHNNSVAEPAATDFPFRVRSIAFQPGASREVVAVTSGCCYEESAVGLRDPRVNFPRYMSFFPVRRWQVREVVTSTSVFVSPPTPSRARTLQDSLFAVGYANCGKSVLATSGAAASDTVSATDPTSAAQPTSRIISLCGANTNPVLDVGGSGAGQSDAIRQYPELSSVRLVAADGDTAGHEPNVLHKITEAIQDEADLSKPDGLLDWAVGQWNSTGQAVAYTTTRKAYGTDAPYPLDCPSESLLVEDGPHVGAQCKPDPAATDQVPSKHVFLLPSYPLNGYTAVGTTGTGWAVGDRGALLRLGGGDAALREARAGEAPKLGSGEPARLSSREAYDAFRPALSDDVGLVPPLSLQADKSMRERLRSWGSPSPHPTRRESVKDIAMSRDGTEGWALGPNRADPLGISTLYHFNGTRWTRCDAEGIEGVLPADPACASLVDLTRYGSRGIEFLALARVPHEFGGDGVDPDQFEAVAVASYRDGASGPPEAVLRYRDGQWKVDPAWSSQLSAIDPIAVELAFASPRDGWLVSNANSGADQPRLFRLSEDGGADGDARWVPCTAATAQSCLDGSGILPTTTGDGAQAVTPTRGLRLTTIGSRVYLYGTRTASASVAAAVYYPMILSIEGPEHKNRSWQREYDPKYRCAGGCQDEQGVLNALSVARPAGGTEQDDTGWGVGVFGDLSSPRALGVGARINNDGVTPLLQLNPRNRQWTRVEDPRGAAKSYLLPPTINRAAIGAGALRSEIVAMPGADGTGSAVAVRSTSAGVGSIPDHPMVWLNPASRRWEAFGTPFSMSKGSTDALQHGFPQALAPDGAGGFWMATSARTGGGPYFYRFGSRSLRPLFDEVGHPVREVITGSAAGGDGSFWVATASGTVYRYDRMTGWDRVTLKGWDVSGVVQSPAHAIAVGRDGTGLVVGKSGRIAEIGPRAVALERSSVLCSANRDNCATTQTLRSVAVAPDGSALAGGDGRTLLWRPSGGIFRAIGAPEIASAAMISGISMPSPDRAWLVTSTGDVFGGRLAGNSWTWVREAVDSNGRTLARDHAGTALRLHGVAIDESDRGYAVGDRGVILKREEGGRWRRIGGYQADLLSVTLGPRGRGALIGGDGGLILTQVGDGFQVARHDEYFDPLVLGTQPATIGGVVGVALLPGTNAGEVEAWAATQAVVTGTGGRLPPPGAILHYASDPANPLLTGGKARAAALPDAPAHQEGELEIAAFGKSDCQAANIGVCTELTGSGLSHDVIARAVRDELLSERGQPDVALFTGDANDVGGARDADTVSLPTSASVMHERWWELVGAPFGRAGIPLFGALGGQDLSHTQACDPVFHNLCAGTATTRQKAGLNLAWRQALSEAPAPWGRGRPRSQRGLTFREVRAIGVEAETAPAGGARTHYAVDVRRDGRNVLRLVVLDTSLKSVSGNAALQNPVRDQLAWLEDVLKRDREPGQPAVVVSETPSYAYESRAGATTDTLTDAAAFETVLVKNRVTAVVSGRLGWNGLYWLVAPGLHAPCPGGSYQADPPRDASQLCESFGQGPTGLGDRVAEALEGELGRPVPKPAKLFQDVAGQLANIPVAVAASAGGKFGPYGEGAGSGSQGFWRGYTRIRVFPGKSLVPVIEQRPVFDWIGIQASEHTLTPGRRLTLRGYGREPLGLDVPARYVEISGPAITHRYDLVLADPERPYLPKVDPTSDKPNGYVPLPDEIGASIDPQIGTVRYAGRGNHPPVYALAILSVGKKTATWPIVFAPRRSFKAPPPQKQQRIVLPPPPRPLGTPVASLPPTPPANVPQPPNLQLNFPPSPVLPNLNLTSPQTQAPPPPAPPPPPVNPAASSLQITPAAVGLNVAPAATVIPPPAPPIQPAPPSGARREARQRQAAAAKSEEGSDQGQEQSPTEGGTQAATRHDPPRDLAFSKYELREQPSAWARGIVYTVGFGIASLTLALSVTLLRRQPRRREPDLPAPAWARSSRRRF